MNFVGEDGDQMKELHWEHGYRMFWIVGSCVTLLILFILHRKVSISISVSYPTLMDVLGGFTGLDTLIDVRLLAAVFSDRREC
jgi:hypothetical protein